MYVEEVISMDMKKIICNALIFSLILFSSCENKTSVVSNSNKETPEVTVKTDVKTVTSDSNKKSEAITIVIDPGHANRSNLSEEQIAPGSSEMKIKDGGGAQGIVTHTPEYDVNMKVSLKLKKILEDTGYRVVMTKSDNSVSLGNIERAEVGNREGASLVIRIHADSSENSSVNGASVLIPEKINSNTRAIGDESLKYGEIVLNSLINEVGMKNDGLVFRKDLTGFNWSKVPVILVEMGFLSNAKEDKLLSSDEYQNKIAAALANGIKTAVPI